MGREGRDELEAISLTSLVAEQERRKLGRGNETTVA